MAHILKRTLVIALPLPEYLGGPKRTVGKNTSTPSKPSTSSSPAPYTYDRAFWLSVPKLASIPVRPILRILGLKVAVHRGNSVRGPITFAATAVIELSNAVNEIAANLPRGSDALIATALDEVVLYAEVEALLARFGALIWSAADERPWLLQVADGVKEYEKDLVFEDADDQAMIKKYLRIWMLAKGFNNWRKEAEKKKGRSGKRKVVAKGSLLMDKVSGTGGSESKEIGGQLVAPSTTFSPFATSPRSDLGTFRSQDDKTEPQSFFSPPQAHDGHGLDTVSAHLQSTKIHTASGPLTHAASIYTLFFQLGHTFGPATLDASSDDTLMHDALTILRSGDNRPTGRSARFLPLVQFKTAPQDITNTSTQTGVRSQRSRRTTVPTYNLAVLGGSARHTPKKYLKKHHGNVLHGSLDAIPSMQGLQIATVSIAELAATVGVSEQADDALTLTSYWTARAWRRFVKTEVVPLSAIISYLGLIYHEKDGVVTYDNPVAPQLSREISRLVMRLYTQLSTEDLIRIAAEKTYLNHEIDELLVTFACLIWTQEMDSPGLFKPGIHNAYLKALVYENDEDEKMIALYLHRWIFAKAFELVREWGSNEKVKQAITGVLGKDAKTYLLQEKQYVLKTSDTKDTKDRRKKRKASPSPVQRPVEGTFSSPPPARKLKVAKRHHEGKSTSYSPSTVDNSQLTTLFLNYLRNHTEADFQELRQLDAIETQLAILTPQIPTLIANKQLPYRFEFILTFWLSYRRTISTAAKQISALSDANLDNAKDRVARARLVTGLRKARDEFIATGEKHSRVEDVLSRGFAGLEKNTLKSKDVLNEVTEGLKGLDKELMELGEKVRKGDGEWIVME